MGVTLLQRLGEHSVGPLSSVLIAARTDPVIGIAALFFQAEAGIRDLYVTGVQTCALPISAARPRSAGPVPPRCASRRRGTWARSGGAGRAPGARDPRRTRGTPRRWG